jgi:nucleotide-binding universal stress UspA family protein
MAAALVRGDPVSTMYGTIVCGITEAPEARAAAQLAAALAGRLGLRVVLVHVSIPHGAEPALGELASELGGHVEARVVSGNRADGLASVAADEGADAIVLGSRPRGARGRRLCCALARELEAITDVPVLIAPPATRERSARRLALAGAPPGR